LRARAAGAAHLPQWSQGPAPPLTAASEESRRLRLPRLPGPARRGSVRSTKPPLSAREAAKLPACCKRRLQL